MIRHLLTTALIAATALSLSAQENAAGQNATQPADKTSLPAAGKVFYSQDFENGAGDEWSMTQTAATRAGQRKFLGQFAEHKVTLKLDKLPNHKYVRLSFDLYAIQSWDGNDINCPMGFQIGPDTWTLCIDDAPPLIDASIALNTEYKATQSYPDMYTFASYPANTGATEKGTLGYGFGNLMSGMDAVFHIDVIVPHTSASAVLAFAGTRGTKGVGDESWGLDNVTVTLYEKPPYGKLDVEKLKALWGDLSGSDPAKADKALWTFIGVENTTDITKLFLENSKLADPKVEIPADVAKLIAQLDDDDWQVREKATKALKEMGDKIFPILRRVLEETKSVEVRTRIRFILGEINVGNAKNSDLLIASRVVRVLRIIGSEETKKALASLEKQYPRLKAITQTNEQDQNPKAPKTE